METEKSPILRLIRQSERFFKTDMVYIAKNGFWLSVGQFVAILSGFILSVVFANTLPKEIYGNYKFILSVTGVLAAMSLTGLGTVVTQAVARGKEAVLKDAVRTQLRWGILVFLGAVVMSIYYFVNDNFILSTSFLIAGIAAPLINAFGLYGSFLNGKKDFKSSTIYWINSQLINVAALIIASLLTHNIVVLVAVYFISNAVVSLFFHHRTISKHDINTERDDSIIKYGIHISAMNIFGTISNQLDKILVFHYLGSAQLAVYAFSIAIPEQLKGSFKNLFNLALPKYASLTHEQMRASIIKKILQLTLYTLVLVGIYILCAPYIYALFFPKYIESVWYSQFYSLGLIAIPAISLFGTYFQLKQQTKVLYTLTVVSNVVTILLTYFLIKRYGLTGAVIENGISWLVILLCYLYFFLTEKKTGPAPQQTV